MKKESLAWRKYPEPDGLDFFESDLSNKVDVIKLFDFCQVLEATIWKTGWCFLFENYGLNGIIEIDKESGWLVDEDLGEWITSIYYHSLISGFEPQKKEFGDYSEKDGIFTNENGITREISFKEIYNLKEKIGAEIILQNGFHNHNGEGNLLVGIVSNGQIEKEAVLIVDDREVKMYKIQIQEDFKYDKTRIEFEVSRNIEPPIHWNKLYGSRIKVNNTTYNKL